MEKKSILDCRKEHRSSSHFSPVMSSSVNMLSVESVWQRSEVRRSPRLQHLWRRRRPASMGGAADVRPEAGGFRQGLGTFYHPPSSALCRSVSLTWKEDQSQHMSLFQVKLSAIQKPGEHCLLKWSGNTCNLFEWTKALTMDAGAAFRCSFKSWKWLVRCTTRLNLLG